MKKLFAALLSIFALHALAQKTYLQCGTLIDGISSSPKTAMTIVVEGTKILSVEAGFKQGLSSDKVIDLKTKTVTPGWIDMHVHLEEETNKNKYLEEFTWEPVKSA